jgi:hypothetical protein
MGQVLNAVAQGFTSGVNSLGQMMTPQNQFQANTGAIQGQQQSLAQALLNQSQGMGPNPAQAQYQQNVNQAIKQNAGLISSQKGINPALAQRLAGENAANMQGNAAGNAAILGAQQQLGAQQGLAGVYGDIANEQLGTQRINAGSAAQNVAGLQNTTGGLYNAIGSAAMQGSQGSKGAYDGGMIGYADGGFVGNSNASQNIADSIMQSAGVPSYQAGNAFLKEGFGKQKKKTDGSQVDSQSMAGGPMDSMGYPGGTEELAQVAPVAAAAKGGMIPEHLATVHQIYHGQQVPMMKSGGKVNAVLSPGEEYISPDKTMSVAEGKESVQKAGKKVPGKAPMKGDHSQNDIVPAKLDVGGIVIPKSVMESKNPAEEAKKFVANELAKKKSKGTPEDFKMALKAAISERKVK